MLLSLMVGAAFAVSTPEEVSDPRNRDAWVEDAANLLDEEAENALNATLLSVLQAKGAEVVVVTEEHVDGDLALFTSDLFAHWGVGRVNQDRGVLLVLVMDSKGLVINAGQGLIADLTQPWLADMQQTVMVPLLATGDVKGALDAGVAAIREQIGASERTYEAPKASGVSAVLGAVPLWGWVGAAVVGVLALLFAAFRMMAPDDDGEDDLDVIGRGPQAR